MWRRYMLPSEGSLPNTGLPLLLPGVRNFICSPGIYIQTSYPTYLSWTRYSGLRGSWGTYCDYRIKETFNEHFTGLPNQVKQKRYTNQILEGLYTAFTVGCSK